MLRNKINGVLFICVLSDVSYIHYSAALSASPISESSPSRLFSDLTGATKLIAPLADVVRPTTIDEFVGQENVIGQDSFLRTVLQTGDVPSLIFWGPPGCGKVESYFNH